MRERISLSTAEMRLESYRPGDAEAKFAVADGGRIVHVSEVDRGRACRCFCAACNRPVVAKKGARNAWHFAHDVAANCSTASETALHLALKQVIADGDVLTVPELAVEETATFEGHTKSAQRILPRARISYSQPRLEVRMGEIVADAIVTSAGRNLIVEVAVTHKVDDQKRKKIDLLGVSALELQAWRLSRDADWAILRAFVQDTFSDRIWIYNGREPVQRQLAHLDALKHAKNASRNFARLQARAASERAAMDEMHSVLSCNRGAFVHKFNQLWAKYGTGTLVQVDLDTEASVYISRWSEDDAAGDPSAYFDLLVEWIRQKTKSIVLARPTDE